MVVCGLSIVTFIVIGFEIVFLSLNLSFELALELEFCYGLSDCRIFGFMFYIYKHNIKLFCPYAKVGVHSGDSETGSE